MREPPPPSPMPATGATGYGALVDGLSRLSGRACMVVAVLLFSGMSVCVKLTPLIPTHEKILVRSVVTVPVLLLLLRRRGLSPLGNNRKLLLSRGLCGLTGMFCYFLSLTHLPMGNAVLLTHASPVFAALFARQFLGERAGRALVWASVACLVGVAFIARPTPHAPLLWSALALGSSVVNGGTYTIVRALARTDHHLVVVLALPLVAIPITGAMCLAEWVAPDARQWALLGAMTVASTFGQIFMTMGMHRETAGRATNMFFLGVVLSLVWGQVLGDPALHLVDLGGAALVVGGILGLSRSKR